ncbi:WecB/TagA/CpsF family glycosyltransferase [Clostridium perfringens]|uniref:WecB/TagA/CpsF family glycosyltransferase n=1 Tax=Clostridium perfringens TaxID=1502 RepID=UPI003AF6D24A
MKICNILGTNVSVTNIKETIDYIDKNLKKLKGRYICVSNVHTTIMAYESDEYRSVQNSAINVLPDGAPLSLVSRIKGFKSAERVTGPDLMDHIFKISNDKKYRHYFYGSTNQTLSKLKENLILKYPNINIVGMYSPPFRELFEEEEKKIIDIINNTNPDFIWVGLGAPKQEIWMYKQTNKLNGLMIGVGAGFDYFSGKIKRAPIWMQKLSLEWLYRLLQEPKRLFKRYFYTNSKFIVLIIKEIIEDKLNKYKG